MTLTPEFEQTTATVTCWRIPLSGGFPATSACVVWTVDADRAAALLAAGVRLAGREWWQVLGEPAPQTGGDTVVLDQPAQTSALAGIALAMLEDGAHD